MSDHPLVTIGIPVLNEARLLPGLLDSLRAQTWPQEAMQIIIADGGSTDATPEIAEAAAREFPDLIVIPNEGRIAAAGLNRALARARGAFFLRLDARARPAKDYVERCVAHLQTGQWAGVGGAQIAVGDNDSARAIALALNHPLGAGRPRYRRAGASGESETLFLGAYLLEWLKRVGGWDETFVANEDYELNTRLRKAGGRLLVADDIRVNYLARDSLSALARQYARYGSWRFVTWRKHPRAMRLRHLAPAAWTAGLAAGAALTPFTPWLLLALTLPYLLAITLAAASLAAGSGWRLFPRIWLAFPVMHLSWGAGFWRRALTDR
jgi:cellulose synthase/poly-beta-1,6-N-acetylglucosamine synthase-like glycosyltransferase